MGPLRKFALPLVAALAVQGCLFLPAEEVEGEDPFFFEVQASGQESGFVEAGTIVSSSAQALPADYECEGHCTNPIHDSTTWFFPVLRVY
ncbi:hypothetical protein [Microbulbifer variabilis]|uniref:hypothetical protein n=1 Tax=Microbulbifer variabilis TaxID=266805 RepID=UPI001CFF0D9F|nr:hypothetical protein [Microbulbifer variabilis]